MDTNDAMATEPQGDEPKGRTKTTRTSNGESSVYQDAGGTWHAYVTMGVKVDGSPDRRHRQAKTRKAVVAKAKELESARDRGQFAAAGSTMTVEQWLNHWIRNIAPTRLREKSLASYKTDVHRHLIPGLGKNRLQRLTVVQIESFYAGLGRLVRTDQDGNVVCDHNGDPVPKYRPATIDHIHRTLRRSLRDAVKANLIPGNPATLVERRQNQAVSAADHHIQPLDVNDARAVIQAALARRNGIRYIIALSHGLRQGECLGLPWDLVNLDADDPTISVRQQLQRHTWKHGCGDERVTGGWPCGKNRGADCPTRHGGGLRLTQVKTDTGARVLALDPVTLNLLRAHRRSQAEERLAAGDHWEDHGLVFTQENGGRIDPRVDAREWKSLLRDAGVPEARLHDARHTAATFLLVQGVSERVVMDLMGWSSVAMIKRYAHVVQTLKRDAADKMSDLLHGRGDTA